MSRKFIPCIECGTPIRAKRGIQQRCHPCQRVRENVAQPARAAMTRAIRDGTLIRLPCEVCGNPRSEGHHDDYSKPLTVRWLCRKHHRRHHVAEWRSLREAAHV